MGATYSLSASFIGFDDLKRAINQGSSIAKNEMAKALNKAANDVQNVAVTAAPKQSGKLKSSIHTEYATDNNLVAKVGTNVEYARAQELGTVGMTINSHSKKGKHFTYIGNIKPKLYMKQGFESGKQNLSGYMQIAIRNMTQRLAGK